MQLSLATIRPVWRYAIGIALASVVLIGLHGCDGKPQVLPQGVQTMTGVLQPVSISITRRGSHLLLQNGEKMYYVESARKDLRSFEGVDVVVSGLVERNTDPDALPVLVASGVTLVQSQTRSWNYAAYGLALDVPTSWSGSTLPDGMQFTDTEHAGEAALKIYPSALTRLPQGAMLHVDGRNAARLNETGATVVYVQNGQLILAFSFPQDEEAQWNPSSQDILRVIRSVHFSGIARSSASAATSFPRSTISGSKASAASAASVMTGAPCGGPAGVLCPSGQYCEITDATDGVGRCRSLKR